MPDRKIRRTLCDKLQNNPSTESKSAVAQRRSSSQMKVAQRRRQPSRAKKMKIEEILAGRSATTLFHCQFLSLGNRPSSMRHLSQEAASPLRRPTRLGTRVGAFKVLVPAPVDSWRRAWAPADSSTGSVKNVPEPSPVTPLPEGRPLLTFSGSSWGPACSLDCGWSLAIAGPSLDRSSQPRLGPPVPVLTEAGVTPAVHLRGPAPLTSPASQSISAMLTQCNRSCGTCMVGGSGSMGNTVQRQQRQMNEIQSWSSPCRQRPRRLQSSATIHEIQDPTLGVSRRRRARGGIFPMFHRIRETRVHIRQHNGCIPLAVWKVVMPRTLELSVSRVRVNIESVGNCVRPTATRVHHEAEERLQENLTRDNACHVTSTRP